MTLNAPSGLVDCDDQVHDAQGSVNCQGGAPNTQDFAGITFVKIEGSSYTFGSPADQLNRKSNEHQQVIPLNHTFWISKYEISQGEWMSAMGSNPSAFKQLGPDMNAPVENITWHQAKAFVDQLNQTAGDTHFRLPAETEWEYVAKAGTSSAWSFGSLVQNLSQYTHRDGLAYPRDKGLKLPNSLGVYDLYGNVYEWCEDWYVSRAAQGVCLPGTGTFKVIRGGSNGATSEWLRSSSRNFTNPDHHAYYIGLRLVYVEDPTQDPYQQ